MALIFCHFNLYNWIYVNYYFKYKSNSWACSTWLHSLWENVDPCQSFLEMLKYKKLESKLQLELPCMSIFLFFLSPGCLLFLFHFSYIGKLKQENHSRIAELLGIIQKQSFHLHSQQNNTGKFRCIIRWYAVPWSFFVTYVPCSNSNTTNT